MGLFMTTHVEVLQHNLTRSKWCFKVYVLQHTLRHSHRCFRLYLLWCGCTATDALGCLAPKWTHLRITVPLVDSGVPVCPVQQHRKSSDALTICQPKHTAIAVINMFPGTTEQEDKQYSSTASSESKMQPLTSTSL